MSGKWKGNIATIMMIKSTPKPSFSMSKWEEMINKLSDKYYSWGKNHTEEEFKKDLKDLLASQREKSYEEGYEDGEDSGHADVVAYLDSDETNWQKAIEAQRELSYKEGYEDGLKADNDPVVELGIHGHDCPDCNGGDCECLCRVCRGLKKV